MKKCGRPTCKRPWKNESEFGKNKSTKDGLQSYCKECRKEERELNKEEIAKSQKRYRETHKDELRKSQKEYRKKNSDKIKENNKQYNMSHKKELNEYFSEYRKNNKEIIIKRKKEYYKNNSTEIKNKVKGHRNTINGKFCKYKSSAKERCIEFNLTFEEFSLFWGKSCHYCGSDIEFVGIDRVNNNLGYNFYNCVPCCEICNRMKNKISIDQWNKFIKNLIIFIVSGIVINANLKSKDEKLIKRKFSQYKNSTNKRKYNFNLTFEQFFKFAYTNCFYCGGDVDIIGLDRTNNNIGYEVNNICSCCTICNFGKKNMLVSEWLNHLNKLVLFQLKKDLNYYKTIIDIEKINNFINNMEENNV